MVIDFSDGDEFFPTVRTRTKHRAPARPPTGHPEHGVGFQLWLAANAWQRSINDALEPIRLTHIQFVLLASLSRIYRADGFITQAALARHAGTDEMMTSQVARHLEAKGLIERRDHPTDARARSISMTEDGARLIVRAVEIVEEADSHFFAPLEGYAEMLGAMLRRLLSSE